jgi:glycosyltransferase involved in cell wall biosynthesis
VDGAIENLGELPHDQALALFERASVFVRPTFADGDAISVREALALGTPVVASDAAERPKGTFLFRTNDVDDLAEKLSEALVGPRLVRRGPDAAPFLLSLYRSLGSAAPVRHHFRESEERI